MEAEAREILRLGLQDYTEESKPDDQMIAKRKKRIEAKVGIWKDRYGGKSTDEIMTELRGDE